VKHSLYNSSFTTSTIFIGVLKVETKRFIYNEANLAIAKENLRSKTPKFCATSPFDYKHPYRLVRMYFERD